MAPSLIQLDRVWCLPESRDFEGHNPGPEGHDQQGILLSAPLATAVTLYHTRTIWPCGEGFQAGAWYMVTSVIFS